MGQESGVLKERAANVVSAFREDMRETIQEISKSASATLNETMKNLEEQNTRKRP